MDKKYLQIPSLLEKIYKAMSDSVYIYDLKDQCIVWLNERGRKLYGYPFEDICSISDIPFYANLIHPEDLPRMQTALREAQSLPDGDVISVEYRFKDRSGKYHWIQDRITAFSRDDKNNVSAILGVASCANERKVNEDNLKKTIEKLNVSLAAAKMGTWEWDIENNTIIWDQRMYEIHGLSYNPEVSPMDAVWKSAFREDMEYVNIRAQVAAQEKKDFYTTYRVTYSNQEVHHIRSYGTFIRSGELDRMYGVAWDSTVEVLTEQQMAEAKAKLISATKMAALGEMSGGIAHEINNPLTVIQARAFQLGQMVEANKLDPEKVKQAAESISRTSDKIARIIKSLRSFAREGTHDPFEVIPVKQIVEETLEFCRTRFYNHGVEIEIVPFDSELEVECRLIQIEQVLLNLLNNSFDAVHELENKWIRICVKELVSAIEIHVIDAGPGIPSSVADQIMLPFFTTKEVGKGTGLGLSISAGILRSHKGALQLDKNAQNTTFIIHLPKWQHDEALNY
ncbi:MAG: PAS domain-containing protein [Bdellovibrio sp.]